MRSTGASEGYCISDALSSAVKINCNGRIMAGDWRLNAGLPLQWRWFASQSPAGADWAIRTAPQVVLCPSIAMGCPKSSQPARPSAISKRCGAQSGHVTRSPLRAIGVFAAPQVEDGLPETTLPPWLVASPTRICALPCKFVRCINSLGSVRPVR